MAAQSKRGAGPRESRGGHTLGWCIRFFLLFLIVAGLPASDADVRQVTVGNLIYAGDQTSVCFSDRFLTTVETEAGINTRKRMHAVRLVDATAMAEIPFAVMNGQKPFSLPSDEMAVLADWLAAGGFLLASAGCSSEQWSQSFQQALEGQYGSGCLEPIGNDHPLFHTLFELNSVPLKGGGEARFEGLILDGRLALLFSRDGLNDTAHTQGCCCCGGNEVKPAEEVMANALVYALVE